MRYTCSAAPPPSTPFAPCRRSPLPFSSSAHDLSFGHPNLPPTAPLDYLAPCKAFCGSHGGWNPASRVKLSATSATSTCPAPDLP